MNKHRFLAPLAVSVAALLGGAVIPVQASTKPAVTITEASVPIATDQLILTRNAAGQLRLADHFSHTSHVSHVSHTSHVSGG
jgi:hypothetical protein